MSNSGARATPPDAPEIASLPRLRLIFIRHASSRWNDERRIQGQLDPPLSEKGREQAARLAERLRGCSFARFYSSDLQRAVETARAVSAVIEAEPELTADLREVGLGEWEGLTRDDIVKRYPEEWRRWVEEPSWDIVPGGEGADVFEARVGNFLTRLTAEQKSGDVLLVTHGGVIQVAILRLLRRRSHGLFPFVIQNTSLTVLEGEPNRMVVARVNDTWHLGTRP
jgi:broad specificity phosphatase PhoE